MASLVFQETHVRALLDLTLLSRGCCCRSVDPHLLCRSRRQDDGLCADGTRGQLLTFMNFNVSGALGRRHTFPWIVCCPESCPIFSAQFAFRLFFLCFLDVQFKRQQQLIARMAGRTTIMELLVLVHVRWEMCSLSDVQ